MHTIGERIEVIRKLRRMKQYSLAREVGISESRLCRIENNVLQPYFWEVERIAQVLGCSLTDLATLGLQGRPLSVTVLPA